MGEHNRQAKRKNIIELLPDSDIALLSEIPASFLRWFRENARDLPWRRDREPYHVWLSEIMLQQTRVEAVKDYYLRFLDALPDIGSLATAPEETVLKLWEGLGYYRRARNLHLASQVIIRDHGGVFPSSYSEILRLPGVGEYTAGAIASICFGLIKPAVDGNCLRVLARILDSDAPVDSPGHIWKINVSLEKAMIVAAEAARSAEAAEAAGFCAGDFNQSLMEIGATLCLPKGVPKCSLCPAEPFCRGFSSGRAELLPIRGLKKSRRIEKRTVFIFWHKVANQKATWDNTEEQIAPAHGRLALCRRDNDGLLAGMWQLPNTAGWLSTDEAIAQAAAWGVKAISLEQVLERNHIFTHVQWQMRGYVILCEESTSPEKDTSPEEGASPEGDTRLDEQEKISLTWTSVADREKAYPLPTAFRLFLDK